MITSRLILNDVILHVSIFQAFNLPDCLIDLSSLIETLLLREKNMAHFLSGYCCNLLACTVFHLYWKAIKCELDVIFLPCHIRHTGEKYKSDNSSEFKFVVVVRGLGTTSKRPRRKPHPPFSGTVQLCTFTSPLKLK